MCFWPEKCRNDFEDNAGVWFLINKGKTLTEFFNWVMSCSISSGLFFWLWSYFFGTVKWGSLPKNAAGLQTQFCLPVRPQGVSANWSVVKL